MRDQSFQYRVVFREGGQTKISTATAEGDPRIRVGSKYYAKKLGLVESAPDSRKGELWSSWISHKLVFYEPYPWASTTYIRQL